jgi:hypothetical protein
MLSLLLFIVVSIVTYVAKKKISSSLRSVDTLAQITDDGYRGGGEGHCT